MMFFLEPEWMFRFYKDVGVFDFFFIMLESFYFLLHIEVIPIRKVNL